MTGQHLSSLISLCYSMPAAGPTITNFAKIAAAMQNQSPSCQLCLQLLSPLVNCIATSSVYPQNKKGSAKPPLKTSDCLVPGKDAHNIQAILAAGPQLLAHVSPLEPSFG